jgi:urease gamma subunit
MTGALQNISNVIDENRGTLDSIQDMAVQLTRTIISLRLVIIKYVDMAEKALGTIVPIIEGLPIISENIKEFARDAQALAKKIDTANELVQKVLPGVERALTTADISGLQASSGEVAELTRLLQDMIPEGAQ